MNEEICCITNEGKTARNEQENDDSNFLRALGSPGAQWVTGAKWVTFRLLSFFPNKIGFIIESCQDVLHHPIFF